MKGSPRTWLGLGLMVLLLPACSASFHSMQWDLVSSIWEDRQRTAEMDELAWDVSWVDEEFVLFPIVRPEIGQTNFANDEGDIVVGFDGRQVIGAQGLLPNEQAVTIERTEDALIYRIDEEVIAEHACSAFEASMEQGETIWRQQCQTGSGGAYTNLRRVNAEGLVELLRFTVHPDYPQIELRSNLPSGED